LYANDIVIFSSTASGLQERHVQHVNYCSDWRLKANVVKIKVIGLTMSTCIGNQHSSGNTAKLELFP
jgi:hypothetical protein